METIETPDNHDRGLVYDLNTLVSRRRALGLLAGLAGTVALAGCGARSSTTSQTSQATQAATVIPTETAGPYPADGSNGPDILRESGIVRRDIRSSFGTGTATAAGVPLTVTLKILDSTRGNTTFPGAAVYLWHCDREGRYSMYSDGLESENYLRGVQAANEDGTVTFQSIFPAAYSGRWPHIHFEIYQDLAVATSSGPIKKTTQLALPEDVCRRVYETTGYERSVTNMSRTSLARDMVFADDRAATQLATMTGSVDGGLTAYLNVVV